VIVTTRELDGFIPAFGVVTGILVLLLLVPLIVCLGKKCCRAEKSNEQAMKNMSKAMPVVNNYGINCCTHVGKDGPDEEDVTAGDAVVIVDSLVQIIEFCEGNTVIKSQLDQRSITITIPPQEEDIDSNSADMKIEEAQYLH
jgi:hypothetical protein